MKEAGKQVVATASRKAFPKQYELSYILALIFHF